LNLHRTAAETNNSTTDHFNEALSVGRIVTNIISLLGTCKYFKSIRQVTARYVPLDGRTIDQHNYFCPVLDSFAMIF